MIPHGNGAREDRVALRGMEAARTNQDVAVLTREILEIIEIYYDTSITLGIVSLNTLLFLFFRVYLLRN